jgi:hypothetical protein
MAVTGVMVMGRRGGATPHPATEPSAASSRFYAAGIAETVHLDTGDVRIFARRASHATMAKAREVTSPEAVHRYPTLAKECRLAGATRIQFRSLRTTNRTSDTPPPRRTCTSVTVTQ